MTTLCSITNSLSVDSESGMVCRDCNTCVDSCHANTLHYAQVLVQHARQSAICSMQNLQMIHCHVDSGADEPVQFKLQVRPSSTA
jgi:ferredoxin